MQIKKYLFMRRGEMMVELLISISIVVVSLLGIFTLVNRALSLNRVNAEQYIATYLASEGIEVAKNIFDRGFLLESANNPGSKEFYSATDFAALAPGVYQVNFDSKTFTPACSFPVGGPTEGAVRKLFKPESGCGDFIQFDESAGGIYGYNLGTSALITKFKRLIIIDAPDEYNVLGNYKDLPAPLEFRITSAVGWESRGGSFVVQLQDHFLPWRIP
jgi:hypothetical protein